MKNIRLTDGDGDHNIACKIDGYRSDGIKIEICEEGIRNLFQVPSGLQAQASAGASPDEKI